MRIIVWIFALILTPALYAQVSNPSIVQVPSTPSACNTLPLEVVQNTNNLYGTDGSGGCVKIGSGGGGGGSSFTLTAATNLAAGTGVSVNGSGQAVQTWGPAPVFASLTTVFADAVSAGNNYWNILPLGSGNYLATLNVNDSASGIGVAISTTNTSIMLGTPKTDVTFAYVASATIGLDPGGLLTPSAAPLSPSSFVMGYSDAGNSFLMTFRAGTISGGVIALGTPVATASTLDIPNVSIAPLSSTSFAATYDDGTDYFVVVGTISGTTITLGTPVSLGTTGGHVASTVVKLSSSSVLLLYPDHANSDLITAVVGSISGTAVTLNTPVALATSVVYGSSLLWVDLFDATHFLVSWRTTSALNQIAAGSMSGTTPSWGSIVNVSVLGGAPGLVTGPAYFQILDSTHVAVALNNATPSVQIYSLSGTTLTPGTLLALNYGTLNRALPSTSSTGAGTFIQGFSNLVAMSPTTMMLDDGLASVYEMDTSGNISPYIQHPGTQKYMIAPSGSSYVMAIFDDLPSLNVNARIINYEPLNLTPPVGITASSVSSSGTATIVPSGAVSGLSGLTPGVQYYYNGDGTLVTANTGHPAGVALSAASLAVH